MNEIIIKNLQNELTSLIKEGCGPFLAAIYDNSGNLISKAANSVIKDNCSNRHAEVNAIELAQKALKTYNLAPYNLGIYITSEPCIMCLGAIMWSGIKRVYYSTPSKRVEEITGFDEGYKPGWQNAFRGRGIEVYPDILSELGENVLKEYVSSGGTIYKPR